MKDRSSDLLGPRASARKRAAGAQFFSERRNSYSRFALIAAGRPQTRRRRAVFFRAAQFVFALRAHCGRDARGPSKSLPKRKRQEAFRPPACCLLPTVYCLGSRFPAPNVFELFCCQSIDCQTQSSEFQAGNLGIDFLGQEVDAGL